MAGSYLRSTGTCIILLPQIQEVEKDISTLLFGYDLVIQFAGLYVGCFHTMMCFMFYRIYK